MVELREGRSQRGGETKLSGQLGSGPLGQAGRCLTSTELNGQGAVRTMVSGGADRLTGRGGVTGSVAGGRAGESTCLGKTGDLKTQDKSTQ